MLELAFDRELAFAPVIVWDALVDPVLVSGWLADCEIEPVAGGVYNLRWPHCPGRPESLGRISVLQPLERLHIDTTTLGLLRFDLTEIEVEGGNRGTGTRLVLHVDVEVERAFAARVRADWLTSLDQLVDLLQGHPVDWPHWDRDRHESWTQHLEAGADTGG